MNVETLSKQIGVNYRTVYRRISQAGLVLDDLKGDDGQLTYEGIQAISALFDNVGKGKKSGELEYNVKGENVNGNVNEKLQTRLKALETVKDNAKDQAITEARAEIERLRGAVTTAEAKAEAAERERDLYKVMMEKAEAEAARWRDQAQQMQETLTRSQEIQAAQLQLLPQRAGVKGFFGRIFGRKDGSGNE